MLEIFWILTILGEIIFGILSIKTLNEKYLISMWLCMVVSWILSIVICIGGK